jgi:hypothetical protein
MEIPSWSICARCGVRIAEGRVYFAHRPDIPATYSDLSRKVCQFAYASDIRDGRDGVMADPNRPVDCINPAFSGGQDYGPFDNKPVPDMSRFFPGENQGET